MKYRGASRFNRLAEAFAVTAVVLLGALIAGLQYWHLPNELSAALATGLSVAVGSLTLWLRRPRPSPEEVAQARRIVTFPIDVAAPFEVLKDLGVAASTELASRTANASRPPYVVREIDARIRATLRGNYQFILLVGKSGDGKSRAMFEALAAEFPGGTLVVPPPPSSDRGALQRIAAPEFRIEPRSKPTFVWLDDIDEFLESGSLDRTTLADLLHRKSPTLTLVATIRNEPFEARMRPTSPTDAKERTQPSSSNDASHLLERAEQILFPAEWMPNEIDAARKAYPTVHVDPKIGLGGQLVGGPQLASLLTLAASTNPAGLAVVLAAMDARRAGVLRPVKRAELESLWTLYLPPRPDDPTADAFEEALSWACGRTRAGVSAVSPTQGGYVAVDYAVALRSGERPGGPAEPVIRADLWDSLIRLLDPDDLLAVGRAAAASGAWDSAEAALERSTMAVQPVIRAWSWFDLGWARMEQSRPADAIAAYDTLISSFGEAPEADLREPAIFALVNRGLAIDRLGDKLGAIAAYDSIVDRYDETFEPALRDHVALALSNKGWTLDGLGESKSAIAAFNAVIDRFADAQDVVMRVYLAKALIGRGSVLAKTDQPGAIASYAEVIKRFGGDPEPDVKQEVARALREKGEASTADPVAAIAAFDEVLTRFANEEAVELRWQVAMALIEKGGVLALETDDPAAAIALYDQVVVQYGEPDVPYLRDQVALALYSKGVLLSDEPAGIAAFDAVIARFEDKPDLLLQAFVAMSLRLKGEAIAEKDPGAAVLAYDEVVSRFGDNNDPNLRENVAKALLDKGDLLSANDLPAARAAYDAVVSKFGEDLEPELREPVATALIHKAAAVRDTDPASAVATYNEVLARFGEDDHPALQELVEIARQNAAR